MTTSHTMTPTRWYRTNITLTAIVAATLMAVSGLHGTGCSVVKATNQPEKKNLAVLTPGTPRNHVIAELGAPITTAAKESGRTDIFAFTQGYSKSAKVGRAFFHGAADLVTLGMWEVVGTPIEATANGTEVKLEVSYDSSDLVSGVTHPQGARA